jgi:hypothetical protein
LNFRKLGLSNTELHTGTFEEWLPRVMDRVKEDLPVHPPGAVLIFVDGDHRGEKLLRYCSLVRDSGLSRAVMILDDIHRSEDMHRAWQELSARDETDLSLELFNTGIIFHGYPVQKGHFKVRF